MLRDRSPKERVVGETLASVVAIVPESDTVCGLPVAESAIVMVAVLVPVAAALKVTLIAQLTPAAKLDPQSLVWAKSVALAPATVMLVTLNAALPELVRVIVCAVVVAPTPWLEKVRAMGETPATGAAPVPERLTD